MILLFLGIACGPSTIVLGEDGASGLDSGGSDSGGNADSAGDSGDTAVGDSADTADTDDTSASAWCFPHGVIADERAEFAYGANVDSFDSSAGVYDASSAGSAAFIAVNGTGACAMTNGGTIRGEIGVGGDPASGYCEEWGASVTGGVSQLSGSISMPTIAAPAGMPASEGDVYVGWGEAAVWGGNAQFRSFRLGYGATLDVTDDAVVLTDDFANEGGTLTIASGKTLDLYVTGDVTLQYGSSDNVAGGPGQLNIYVIGGGTVSLAGGATVNARIYAPEAALTTAATFSGAWVSATATAQWGSNTHLDAASLCP
ncbi:hypothetical protein LBMAG42_36580 [Deltaproteobacteria bacterium]|nr:hypothetical protein LBMAG42_36580 [Deltaproteobacteria bacterium]